MLVYYYTFSNPIPKKSEIGGIHLGEEVKITSTLIEYPMNTGSRTYKITEVNTKDGWHNITEDLTVEVNSEIVEKTITNGLSKGILQIVKTVPETEKVVGLTFEITGLGKVNYINKEGKEVLNNTSKKVTIGEDSSDENITIETLENKTVKKSLVGSSILYYLDWIDNLTSLQSKGVHNDISLEEARSCIIQTYIFAGEILNLYNHSNSSKTKQ